METLPDDADLMPGLDPVPLLQRQSASESRWTRTAYRYRDSESARKIFRERPFLYLTKMEAATESFKSGKFFVTEYECQNH